jgi:hypothetical protein
MPTISEYTSNIDISIDVDVEEFLDDCSKREIEEVIQCLVDFDWIKPTQVEEGNVMDIEWFNTVSKLHTLRQRLTVEEEELIKSIVNKY